MATVGTLTSLQAASALSLFKGLGLDVNSSFNSNVTAYTTSTLVSLGGSTATLLTLGTSNVNIGNAVVSHTGRYGTYYGGTYQDLGATTIPALTQTVPSSITSFTGNCAGNITYQIDKAIGRALGANASIDMGYFINTFLLAESYAVIANKYINAIDISSKTNFTSYGVNNYQGLVSQGWDKYQTGKALTLAFKNIGVMTDSISTGKFGTSGAVAYVLIARGLGNVGNLSTKLTSVGVNLNDLTNSRYDSAITNVLSSITDPVQLTTIQQTIESSIPKMASLNDYTSISACAGIANDSAFASFAEVGLDLYKKSTSQSFTSGADVADVIESIVNPKDTNLDTLAGPSSILSTTITNQLSDFLPIHSANATLSVNDIIGSPSGYYDSALGNVIEGINQLASTDYGAQITTALNDIVTTLTDPDAPNLAPYYGSVSSAVSAYDSLLTTIVNDSSVHNIVNQINTNYTTISQHLETEYNNWNKAKFYTGSFGDSMTILSFAQSLPQFAQDYQKTDSGTYLLGMVQNDVDGSTIRGALLEGKNYQKLQSYGVSPNGYVAG